MHLPKHAALSVSAAILASVALSACGDAAETLVAESGETQSTLGLPPASVRSTLSNPESVLDAIVDNRPSSFNKGAIDQGSLVFLGKKAPKLSKSERKTQEEASWKKMHGKGSRQPSAADLGAPRPDVPVVSSAQQAADDAAVAAAQSQASQVVFSVNPSAEVGIVDEERAVSLNAEIVNPSWGADAAVMVLDRLPYGYQWFVTKGGMTFNVSLDNPGLDSEGRVEEWLGEVVSRVAPS